MARAVISMGKVKGNVALGKKTLVRRTALSKSKLVESALHH